MQGVVRLHGADDRVGSFRPGHGKDPLPELGAELSDGVEVGEVSPALVDQEAGHLKEWPKDPGPECLVFVVAKLPVHQGTEVIGGIPSLTRLLPYFQLGRGFEDLPVGAAEVM
jgi:hypothetical protein